MCDHPQLRFQWMRFLPPPTGYHTSDKFWNVLVDLIKEQLLGAQVMVPLFGSSPQKTIEQVKRFPKMPSFLDQHGNPLFDDLDPASTVYLSKSYKDTDLDILRNYGLELLTMQDMIDRVEADLQRPSSKMKFSETDFDWHSRAATLLKYLALLPPSFSALCAQRLRSLPLLPLGDWMWVSSSEGAFYFPTTSNGIEIPPGLGLQTVGPKAAANPDRRDLFLALGVILAKPEDIRLKILAAYKKCPTPLGGSIEWLRFLYLAQPEDNKPASDYADVTVASWAGKHLVYLAPSKVDVYFPGDASEYGPVKLGLKVNLLLADFLKDPPVESGNSTATAKAAWKSWLHKAIGVRERLRLVSPDGSKISDEVLHVAEHLPERFLGLLHHLWSYEGEQVRASRALCCQLGALQVLCEGGEKHPLSRAILPTPQLKSLAARYLRLRVGENLPFLKLPMTLWDGNILEWKFLEHLGVTGDDNLEFYLDMVGCIVDKSFETNRHPEQPYRILDLYKAIHWKCITSANPEGDREHIRHSFHDIPGVYVSAKQDGDVIYHWDSPEDCLLKAPADLLHKPPVDTLYEHVFGKSVGDLETVKQFFRDTLGIPTLGWRDYVKELKFLRDEKCSDFDLIEAQYKRLQAARLSVDDTKELR